MFILYYSNTNYLLSQKIFKVTAKNLVIFNPPSVKLKDFLILDNEPCKKINKLFHLISLFLQFSFEINFNSVFISIILKYKSTKSTSFCFKSYKH